MQRVKNKIAAFIVIVSIIFFVTMRLSARECSDVPPGTIAMSMAKCCFSFSGEASGGTMMFCNFLGGKAKCAIVETTAGEPAEKVISRLADVIDETNPFWWGIAENRTERIVYSSGGDLRGLAPFCSSYIIAGTETGLGIPQPPHSFTCNYNPDTNIVSLRWINPSPDAYDSVRIMFHSTIGGTTLPGKSERYDVNLNDYSYSAMLKNNQITNEVAMFIKEGMVSKEHFSNLARDLVIWVFGIRNDIPSNASGVHLKNNIQEEILGIPFTSGIAPNWQPWALDSKEQSILLNQGIRKEYAKITTYQYDPAKTPETKPYYQVINAGSKGGTGGVYRKFIGLTPGHTYRIKTRVATLSEPNGKDWSVSVFAAANPGAPGDGKDLSPMQMAGFEALPFPGTEIKTDTAHPAGQFAEISTGKTIGSQEIKDITLPAGVDSITVWVKCSASSAMSAAVDWLSLEDLSSQKP